ncbi:transposase [Candidatus Enterovibrio escicola]|uniref:Mobile element protein n=1 Tax=Candidatus Enterovibrio escicola TaxID=1927127 RepID=A0A2A5T5V0_9GAMM|nr:transposase [Candidatus Enterovibrio escacola]PCS23537.1 Mobile element protein [Candidatus Enterovibrio escacola]
MFWFYGFKSYLIINDQSGMILIKVTTANVDDRKPVLEMADEIWGCLYGEKGISMIHWSGNLQTRE